MDRDYIGAVTRGDLSHSLQCNANENIPLQVAENSTFSVARHVAKMGYTHNFVSCNTAS